MAAPSIAGHRISFKPNHRAVTVFMLSAMVAAGSIFYLHGGPTIAHSVLLLGIAIASIPLLMEMLVELAKGRFGVDLLAALSIGSAIAFGQYWVAAIVTLMLSGGKSLEEFATRRASSVLSALARRMPHSAHRVEHDGTVSDIECESIAAGELLVILPHELCPVDGVVVEGDGTMDESYLTGEPFLISKAPGATTLSGAINGDAALKIRATRRVADSRYARIVEVLHASEKNRPRIRRIAERLGAWYTPLTVALAATSWIWSGNPDRFLAVLVIATPCPLLLAIPVAIIGAVSVGARRGILIKDTSILEKLHACRTLIVDKTGTLTLGKPRLSEIISVGAWDKRTILQLAASLEQYSKHPLSAPVLAAARDHGLTLVSPQDVFEFPGQGLRAHIQGDVVMLTGRARLAARQAANLIPMSSGLECVVLINGEVAGVMQFRDEPRHDSRLFLQHVKARHRIKRVVLLSGDRPSEVSLFAATMGIAHQYGGKSPEEKVAIVRELTAQEPTLYIGDGINDAPAMMTATAGIALGVNSDITAEAAGAVILQSSLESVDELIHIGARMRRIALISAGGGMALSGAGMVLSALGYLAPIEGAILQEIIDLLAIFNALRMILPSAPLADFKSNPVAKPPIQSHATPAAIVHL